MFKIKYKFFGIIYFKILYIYIFILFARSCSSWRLPYNSIFRGLHDWRLKKLEKSL